ncbi:MAG: hypothetical protein Q8P66_01260 [Candidatus Colwellbacteria bacterium]|nr:hypothetical protein [Candidatus Colwellbacteria bacterium]
MNKPRLIIASAYAAILTIIFVVVVTIWAELAAPLKSWLTAFSGHHWTSKSILSILLYVAVTMVMYRLFRKPEGASVRKALSLLIIFTVLGVVALTAFYTGHHLKFF